MAAIPQTISVKLELTGIRQYRRRLRKLTRGIAEEYAKNPYSLIRAMHDADENGLGDIQVKMRCQGQ